MSPGNFGDTHLGDTDTKEITVTNTSDEDQEVQDLTIAGANAGEFAVTENHCPNGTKLAPGESCTVEVRFAPAAEGTRAAAVTVIPKDGEASKADVQGTGEPADSAGSGG
jgi:hypothetical protein